MWVRMNMHKLMLIKLYSKCNPGSRVQALGSDPDATSYLYCFSQGKLLILKPQHLSSSVKIRVTIVPASQSHFEGKIRSCA